MAEFVLPHFPLAQVRARGRNGNVRQIQRGENSPFFERRRDGYAMEGLHGIASKNVDVASEIQYRVGISGFYEEIRHFMSEKSLSYGSEIEFHPGFQNDFPSFDSNVFKIRTRRRFGDFGNEIPAFEIVGIPEKRDVSKRIEISFRKRVAFSGSRQEFEKLVRYGEATQTVEHGKRRIRNESGKFLFEVGNPLENALDERVKAPVVFTEKRDDEQGPEGAERIVELSFQRTTLRS